MKPFFTVVIPTYNRAGVLGRALSSVLGQSFPDFELIVVDDGSTDNTKEVIFSFADKRIRYLPLLHNQGVNTARNVGVRAARGEWVAFLDSDDEYMPEALNTMRKYIRGASDSVGVLFFPAYNATTDQVTGYNPGIKKKVGSVTLIPYEDMVLKRNIVGDMTSCVSSRVFQGRCWFPEEINGLEALFWARVAKRRKILFVNEIIEVRHYDTGHQLHAERLSLRYPEAVAKALEEHLLEHRRVFSCYSDYLAKICTRIAFCHALSGQRKAALEWTWKGLRVSQTRVLPALKRIIPAILLGQRLRAYLLQRSGRGDRDTKC